MARFIPLPGIVSGVMGAVGAIQTITQLGQAVGSILKPGSGAQGYPQQVNPKQSWPQVPTCLACNNDRGNADCNWQFLCWPRMIRWKSR